MVKAFSLFLVMVYSFTTISFSQTLSSTSGDTLGPFLITQLFERSIDELSDLTGDRAGRVMDEMFFYAAVLYANRLADGIRRENLDISLIEARDSLIRDISRYCDSHGVDRARKVRMIEAVYIAFNDNASRESLAGREISRKLHTPLETTDKKMSARFAKGGADDDGYGVSARAAIDGSFAIDGEGDQGYYVYAGRKTFMDTVGKMRHFFQERERITGKPIKYVIKPGIGGQHTPNQAIKECFELMDITTGQIVGEYELGKDYEDDIMKALSSVGTDVGWDQIAIVPSSKSGTTDETMVIFVELTYLMLKNAVFPEDPKKGAELADIFLATLHELNFKDGKEKSNDLLFDTQGQNLVDMMVDKARNRNFHITRDEVKYALGKVIGNMFFETTDNPAQSRLSAFIRRSGLGEELQDNAPGFGAMFENVGGRWTGDLHMMLFLAYHDLDPAEYWDSRYRDIKKVREGRHLGNALANKILDENITRIALVVPDHLFWFGKAMEQNFNESIWQEGFATLITIKERHWQQQADNYRDRPGSMVINLSETDVSSPGTDHIDIFVNKMTDLDKQGLAEEIGRLFTTFYGMTHTVGVRLISRALEDKGLRAEDVDMNDLDNEATQIVQKNLFVLQPYVELGKGLLKKRLEDLQEKEREAPGAINASMKKIKEQARERYFENNVPGFENIRPVDKHSFVEIIKEAMEFARREKRIFVPFIYLEGERFYDLRDIMAELGIEWILQGTGDQHISYQQVLSQPQAFLPFIISVVPEQEQEGRPAIGFAKGYLDNISPNMIRDYFAEASYRALTEEVPRKQPERKDQCRGFFLRLLDDEETIGELKDVFVLAAEALRHEDKEDSETIEEMTVNIQKIARDLAVHTEVQKILNGASIDNTEIAIIMDKDLTKDAGRNISKAANALFQHEYRVMKQNLAKLFPNDDKGVIEVEAAQIAGTASSFLARGKKVIILDSGYLRGNEAQVNAIDGEIGRDYCIISTVLPSDEFVLAPDTTEFINLKAMALMGVAILTEGRDLSLFEKAYRLFSGNEPSPELMDILRSQEWFADHVLKVIPRFLKLTENLMDERAIRRLFTTAA